VGVLVVVSNDEPDDKGDDSGIDGVDDKVDAVEFIATAVPVAADTVVDDDFSVEGNAVFDVVVGALDETDDDVDIESDKDVESI
jgi:hypothetical protein